MFLDEARIASGIQHPNVAQILDLGEQADVLFIVMEWVDGDSLAKIRKLVTKSGHTLPIGVILRILADASAGLHAAHELKDDQGHSLEVVHRDVSPQNVLVSTAGAVKIIDFGIAKAQNRQQGSTRTGIVKGKIQYMAPEQVKKGRTVDRRADIWALGVTLHELVTGKLPYDGEDDVEVIRCLMTDEPPKLAPETPEAIARVLARSMVLDADARFPTAAGMQRGLEAAMKELGETTTSEDVAAFIRSELPDLANKRRDVVAKAVDQARERGTPVNTAPEPDVAFAPTQMSERFTGPETRREGGGEGEASSFALTRRKDSGNMRASAVPTLASEDSRLASSLDHEPITIPRKNRQWLWALLLLLLSGGAGTAFMFPAEANRILVTFGLGRSDTVEPLRPSPGTPASASSAPQLLPPMPVSAAPAPAPVPSASSPASAASLSAHHPEPLHHTWPQGAASTSAAPSASGAHALHTPPLATSSAPSSVAAPSPPAASAAQPAPPAESAAPASSDEDPNNPYSVPRPSSAAPPL